MKSNRIQGQLALFCALLLFWGTVPHEAQAQVAAGSDEPRHDYRLQTGEGTTFVRILRTKSDVDSKLAAEKGLVSEGQPDLSAVAWHTVTRWRLDPVTSSPLTTIQDIINHKEEIFQAVETSIILPEEAKAEFREKIASGECEQGPLSTRFFQAMANRSSVNWKIEVEERLAQNTQECRFFLTSINQPVHLVMDCGNFVFPFTAVTFATTKSEERVELTGCIEVVKEALRADNDYLRAIPQFTFSLDGERIAFTDSTGRATFANVPVGQHVVSEVLPTGWEQIGITPLGGKIMVVTGETCATVLFKNRQILPPVLPPVVSRVPPMRPQPEVKGKRGKKWPWVVAAIAGGALAGGVVAIRGGGGSPPPSPCTLPGKCGTVVTGPGKT